MKYIIVGLGNIGKKRLNFLKKKEVVATVDPYNKDADYIKIDKIDIKSYDSVILSCPDKDKFYYLKKFLALKKNVLVEKPLIFKNSKNLKEIFDKFKKKKLILYVAYNHRFEPLIKNIKKIIDRGSLGKIYVCEYFYGNGTSLNVKKNLWKSKIKSGVAYDLFPHLLDLHYFLFKKKNMKILNRLNLNIENKYPDYCDYYLDANPTINLKASYLSWKNKFSITIVGSKGDLEMNCLSKWGRTQLIFRKRKLPSGIPSEKIIYEKKTNYIFKTEHLYFEKLIKEKLYNQDHSNFFINEVMNKIKII